MFPLNILIHGQMKAYPFDNMNQPMNTFRSFLSTNKKPRLSST